MNPIQGCQVMQLPANAGRIGRRNRKIHSVHRHLVFKNTVFRLEGQRLQLVTGKFSAGYHFGHALRWDLT